MWRTYIFDVIYCTYWKEKSSYIEDIWYIFEITGIYRNLHNQNCTWLVDLGSWFRGYLPIFAILLFFQQYISIQQFRNVLITINICLYDFVIEIYIM